MPYLKRAFKEEIDTNGELVTLCNYLFSLSNNDFLGALNYLIFRIVNCRIGKNTSYAELAGIIGTLDCSKEEIRRRILNPYEDKKITENGDVL